MRFQRRMPYRKFKRNVVLFIICSVATGMGYILFQSTFYTVRLPYGVNEDDFLPFEPDITEDFPTSADGRVRIPHIIHQTYKDENIPEHYVKYIRSFVDRNPNWEYYFWTDDSARQLIKEKHPDMLELWDAFNDPINRADALRYVILYEYGGVYADTDYECLRPFDRVTYKYSCVFPTEPFEQVALRLNIPYLINNAIMLCRPKHPFLKQLMRSLAHYQMLEVNVDIAGPKFVTSQFTIYNNFSSSDYHAVEKAHKGSSPYFYKGALPEDHDNAVYVPNTRYFTETMDTHGFKYTRYYWTCRHFESLTKLKQRACVDLKRRGFYREKNSFTYGVHHWFQSYNPISKFLKSYLGLFFGDSKLHIREIVPKYKMYGRDFH